MARTVEAALVLVAGLSVTARAQMAETYVVPLPQDPSRWSDAASKVRESGHSCPEVKSMTIVGQDERGDNYRIECGAASGPADPTLTFRMTSSGIERWK